MQLTDQGYRILSSTYATSNSSGENFIDEFLFTFQISGSLIINDGKEKKTFKEGEFRLSIRNKLAKFTKQVPAYGVYHSVSVVFDQTLLREFALEYNYNAHPHYSTEPVLLLKQNSHYLDYFNSLTPFLQPSADFSDSIVKLKIKEALLTLLKLQPELKDILFDFNEPAKINIAVYMEQNFRFNLSIQRFAYLTGRSISSFKRDFQQVFGVSPGRWLLSRRLKEAYHLISQQGQTPSDVYITVGFEDISHFSRAFKSQFGIPPSRLNA
ncbi:helix-turn-helix domain-containing protein [Mucilaginibacter celer]|uniref:Helix-turn-helix domain-containing protein n=1 Tax=Mucilaginibacter celer TaxID=2305508 RepID=A0A494VQ71_9SPHI|nr:AraC family transcriptional regulator [Mucilaginibacter celer]AYL95360.1 helix-turn-helix domain-containing protein [Mucilaginibacter celer]